MTDFSGQQSSRLGRCVRWIVDRKVLAGALAMLLVVLTIQLGNNVWQSHQKSARRARDRQFCVELNSILADIQKTRKDPSPDFSLVKKKIAHVSSAMRKAAKADNKAGVRSYAIKLSRYREDLVRLTYADLTTVSEAEVELTKKLTSAASLLNFPPPANHPQLPEDVAAIAEIERLGGIVTSDLSRPGQPVTALVLKGNQFHDRHLDHLPQVVTLEIESSEVTDAGLQTLQRMHSLTTCKLRCEKVTDAGIAILGALPTLREVHLTRCSGVTDSGLLVLERVMRLDLSGTHITDGTLSVLKDLPILQDLTVGSDSLTDEGIGALASLPRLKALYLSHCHELTDEALSQIAEMQNLESLGIEGTNITDLGLESIGKMDRLLRLVLAPCNSRMIDGLKITNAGLIRMKNVKSLESFSIRSCPGITDTSVGLIQTMVSLKRLQLYQTGITDQGHAQIVSSLKNTQVDFATTPSTSLDGEPTSNQLNDAPPSQTELRAKE